MTPTILDAAASYLESSPQWPIIPIRPGDKRPLIRTGTDHAEHATTDLAVVESWLVRWPTMYLGMPTGAASGTVVIDADAKHDGEALLAVLERADVLGPLPRERVVRTRSGGLHIYCAHPGGVRVRSGAEARSPLGRLLCGRPGVDVRADGGLVVLPPSPGYAWIHDDDGHLPPLPQLWLHAIQGAGDPVRPVEYTMPSSISDDRRVQRARAYLARMPSAIEGSGGDAATANAITAMAIGFDLDEATTYAVMASDYNPRCDPPWTERDLRRKIRSIATGMTRLPRGYLLGDRG